MILDVAARRAELTPERRALWWQGAWFSYAELNDRAARAAAALAAAGVKRGDRVSILAHNHIAHIDLILASAKAGFSYAPLNARLAAPEQRAMTEYLRPTVLLHDTEAAVKAAATGVPLWSLDEHEARLAAAATDLPPVDLDPEDIQMILPTGGTTGLPKGAMLPYRQGFYNAVNTVMSWGLNDDDCVVQATPCYHAAVNAFTTPLFSLGGKVVLQSTFDPAEYFDLVAECGVTILFLVPTMFKMLADHPAFATADLSGIRWAISGGASCPQPVREEFAARGVAFRQGYGLTEAGVNCFSITTDQAAQRPWSVGKPIMHARAVVRGPDGAPCRPGETGELTLAGEHVFAGYFDRPQATAEVLRDGWLWTGDLARVDDEGFFAIVGRRKEMFVSGGENVFPIEVEGAIYDHPAVAECAVIGVHDERWGEVGLAVVVLRPGAAVTEEGIKAHLRGRVASYKVPKYVRFAAELPKSAAGKVLKQSLVPPDLGAAP